LKKLHLPCAASGKREIVAAMEKPKKYLGQKIVITMGAGNTK